MDLKVVIIDSKSDEGTGLMINNKYVLYINLRYKQLPKTIKVTTTVFHRFLNLDCNYVNFDLPNYIIFESFRLLYDCTFFNKHNVIYPSVALYEIDGQNEKHEPFQDLIRQWYNLIKNVPLQQTENILVKSIPFGNKQFINTFTKGIISNLIGERKCLILSDCPTTVGCEGSPVYVTSCKYPIGIVLVTTCWWQGDFTGLTIILNLQKFFAELLSLNESHTKLELEMPLLHNKLLDAVEFSLVQVYSGRNWGTGIVLDLNEGYIITNAHVIQNDNDIKLYWRETVMSASILYKSPNVYDLAIIQCKHLDKKLTPIKQQLEKIHLGDTVYAIGYALIPKNQNCKPLISKGIISQDEKSMIKTTCCINPGMSGGPILNSNGNLIGIIVSNSRFGENECINPRFNMSIPYSAISDILNNFIRNKDVKILGELHRTDNESLVSWNFLLNNSKL